MNDKIRLLLFVLLSSNFWYLSKCQMMIPFICNSPDDVSNLKVNRIFSMANQAYLILDEKYISFLMPICYEKADENSNGIICAVSHSFINQGISKYPTDEKFKLKGHIINGSPFNFYAVYENIENANLSVRRIIIDDGLLNELNVAYTKDLDTFRNSEYSLRYNYTYATSSSALISFNETDKLNLEFTENNTDYKKVVQIKDYKLNQLIAYDQYNDNLKLHNNKSFILIDSDSQKMHISFFELKDDIKMSTSSIDFKEFFNCHKRIEDPEDLKGIFLNEGIFFIFIRRSYLQINEDLFKSSFKLTDENYENFKELPTYYQKNQVFFNIELPKLVKTIRNKGLLVCFDMVYELRVENQQLVSKNQGTPTVRECSHSTLQLREFIFCFTPEYYYAIYDGDTRIPTKSRNAYETIFNGSGADFDEGEKVEVVYSISDEKFVLMTYNSFYIISYKVVKIIEAQSNRIFLNRVDSDFFTSGKHCLFGSCEKKKPDYNPPTKVKRSSSDSSILIIALVSFAIAIMALAIFYKRNQISYYLHTTESRIGSDRKSDKKGTQKFEARKHLTEKDMERKKNYKRLFKDFFHSLSRSLSIFNINQDTKLQLPKTEVGNTKSSSDSSKKRVKPIHSNDAENLFDSTKLHGTTKSFGLNESKLNDQPANIVGRAESQYLKTDSNSSDVHNISELEKKPIIKKIKAPSLSSVALKNLSVKSIGLKKNSH